jgi:hypothetical protein
VVSGSATVCALPRGLEEGALAPPGEKEGYGEPRLLSPSGWRDDDGDEVTVGISGGGRLLGRLRFGRGARRAERSEGVDIFDAERCRDSWVMS